MSDFDDNWQIKGSSDPATPDIQPNQVTAPQPAPAVPTYQPQKAPAVPTYQPQTAPQPQAAPAVPTYQPQQPVQQVPYQQVPVQQPVYQTAPVYHAPQPISQSSYGYAVQQPAIYQQPVDYATFAAERDKNLFELQKMISHFSPKIDVFQKYEKLNSDIVKCSQTSVSPLVWGILVSLFGIGILITGIVNVKYDANRIGYYIMAIIVLLFGAGLGAMYVIKKVTRKKKIEKYIVEAGELSTQLTLIYNGYGECPLAPEYVDPRLLFKLQQLIVAGRCATISDSLNMLITYQRNFHKIEAAKAQFSATTAERYEGKPAFFNAVSYFNLR